MKLFRKEEMRRLESAAGEAGVSLAQLMDRAGAALAREILDRTGDPAGLTVVLLCGSGNNGGDGFVCAAYLAEAGADCTVVLAQGQPGTELARAVFDRLPATVTVLDGDGEQARQALRVAAVLVDCVFGFGFRGSLSGTAAELIALANLREDCLRVAADLPSGAECDTGRVSAGAFRADVTVSFTGKKPAQVSYPAKEYCGETVVRQVGVPEELYDRAQTRFFTIDGYFPSVVLRAPDPQSNKGSHGTLLLVCGSYGMAGACVLAARAALRCGVGLVRIAADRRIYPILAQAVPEAVFLVLDWESRRQESRERLCRALEDCSACLIGCGLGELSEVVCPTVFLHGKAPLVVDADALNFCARHPGVLEDCEAPLILTPHPGEMARLCDDSIPEIQADRVSAARIKARETGAVVVLKGAATVVAAPGGMCGINESGNAGMAKGGSGDALAGMVAALAAQGIDPFAAAASGVYLHGLAGDLAARELGMRSMLPGDLIEKIPQACKNVQNLVR